MATSSTTRTKRKAAPKRKPPEISIRALMRSDIKREAAKAAEQKAREIYKASRKREIASQKGWEKKSEKEREKAAKEYYKAKDERRRAWVAAKEASDAAKKARAIAMKPIFALQRARRRKKAS